MTNGERLKYLREKMDILKKIFMNGEFLYLVHVMNFVVVLVLLHTVILT